MDISVSAIIVAAGAANRFGGDKLKLPFAGTTVALAAVRPFVLCPKVEEVVFVAPKGQAEEYSVIFHRTLDYDPWRPTTLSNPFDPDGKLWQKRPVLFWQVTEGGDTRTESVKAGLEAARGRFVLVHDGARPNVSIDLVDKIVEALLAHPDHGILPVTPVVNSVLTVGDEGVQYLDRSRVRELQTPQGFDAHRLKEALAQGDYTDEGSAYARTNPILTVEGEVENRKLTYPQDYWGLVGKTRYGAGYDIHRLAEGRPLKLGGCTVLSDVGLEGHSDADVVLHAVMDALLSAVGLPDIGHYFPVDDSRWEGANSAEMLAVVLNEIAGKGATPTAVSVAIVAERPYLGNYKLPIRSSLSNLLRLPLDAVGLTATTNEDVDFEEPEEREGMARHIAAQDAIAAFATVTVRVLP